MITALFAALCLAPCQDDEKIKEWIEQLTSDYEEERTEARKQLEAVKEKAETHLIDALGKDDHRIRRACIELLLAAKSKKAVEPIAKVFKDATEERTVRDKAFEYLKSVPKDAEQHLIDALDTTEETWKIGALEALKEINSAKCAEKVSALYDKETNAQVKAKAFDCLQNLGKPAQPHLLKLLGSNDSSVRLGALNGLEKIGASNEDILEPVAKIFKTESDDAVLRKSYEVLITAKEKAQPHFVEGLKSAQEGVRLKSLDGLIQLELDGTIASIAACFEGDTLDSVRLKAREALEHFGKKSEDALCKALENKNPKVRLETLKALTQIKSEKPFDAIAEMYSKDADKSVHEWCFNYLLAVPQKAEKQLLLALKDENAVIRLQAIEALGKGQVLAAIGPLIDLLADLNGDIKQKATDALVRIGPKAIEAVNAGLKAGTVKKAASDEIIAKFYQEEVERLLMKLITNDGGTGYFDGQFKEIETFGKEKALPVLVKIALDDGYQFRVQPDDKMNAQNLPEYMKELATISLGFLGDESTAKALKDALKDRQPGDDRGYPQIAVALYRLGEKAPFEAYVKEMTKIAEERLKNPDERPEGYQKIFMIGIVQNRIGAHEEAMKTYQKLLKTVEEQKGEKNWQGWCALLYNIACLHALGGDKAKAVEMLGRSVDAGFKDHDWIELDKDLSAIRDEDGYKKLMADAKRFEKPKDQ